jgi:IS66 Orf2 like protein
MTLLPAGVKVHLAFGDMRKGINGLAMLVQGVLRQDPFSGHLFVFRGRKANLIKIVVLGWHRPLPLHQAARARRLPLAGRSWRAFGSRRFDIRWQMQLPG